MPIISPLECYKYALQAGWGTADAITATAIAMGESGLKTDSYCLNCFPGVTEESCGLWQINIHVHTEYTKEEMFDPLQNAKAAWKLWAAKGGAFSDWTVFKTNKYKQYLSQVSAAAAQVKTDANGNILNPDGTPNFGLPSTTPIDPNVAGIVVGPCQKCDLQNLGQCLDCIIQTAVDYGKIVFVEGAFVLLIIVAFYVFLKSDD